MKKYLWLIKISLLALPAAAIFNGAKAQQYDCSFKEPLIKIDFGTSNEPKSVNLSSLKNYTRENGGCPNDGYYSYTSFTGGCFNNTWHTLNEDHTPNDVNGRMLLVNASVSPGTFFLNYITGLKPGSTFEISAWVVNVCRYGSGCIPANPELSISILTASGKQLAKFETGPITASGEPNWQRYYGIFTIAPDADVILIKMDDLVNGGCGNDFAIDDIMIRECVMQKPAVLEIPKPTAKHVTKEIIAVKPIAKKITEPILKKNNPVISKVPVKEKPPTVLQLIKEMPVKIPAPRAILTRANPVVKQIETGETEMVIDLYDNGEIDGDTVSIYHNNELIVSHAGLSEKPITIRIKVDGQHPHHELVMVADNLGSIPPNTSLMVITAMDKRYEIFISSSEQKNAKVVIDLKEK